MATTAQADTESDASDQPVKVPHRWRNLAAMTGVEVVDNTEASLLSTLFPSIASALRLDNTHLGLLSSLGKLVAVPFGPAWVWVGDRIGRKRALIFTTVFGGVLGILGGFSQNFVQLLLANTAMSAALTGGLPITNAIMGDQFDDRSRGRAVAVYYGAISVVSYSIGPLLALFTGTGEGWRYGMFVIGGICILAALILVLFFHDPGVGASEHQLADLTEEQRKRQKPTLRSALGLFTNASFDLMLVSRLLSGHLLIGVFGIQFLVIDRGFTNATAALVLVPFGVGYCVGTLGSGFFTSWLDGILPYSGRIAWLQFLQLAFAVAAFFATQFTHSSIVVYGVFWALMGAIQGANPPVNRPIVHAIVLPELRGQAFAIFATIFATIGWATFNLSAGRLADIIGIQQAFLYILVLMMVLNALLITPLYFTYKRDVQKVETQLDHRRAVLRGHA
jgi:MFS family permease